jgi:hypothetical protein
MQISSNVFRFDTAHTRGTICVQQNISHYYVSNVVSPAWAQAEAEPEAHKYYVVLAIPSSSKLRQAKKRCKASFSAV